MAVVAGAWRMVGWQFGRRREYFDGTVSSYLAVLAKEGGIWMAVWDQEGRIWMGVLAQEGGNKMDGSFVAMNYDVSCKLYLTYNSLHEIDVYIVVLTAIN